MLKLCDDIDTMAMTMLDGELAEPECQDLELHLIHCASCKDHVEHERASRSTLRRRLAAPPAPALLHARLHRALDEADRARRTPWRTYLLPAGAALAAVAALVLFVTTSRSSAPAPIPDVAVEPTAVPTVPIVPAGGAVLPPSGWTPTDLQIQRSGSELLGDDVARLHYWLVAPNRQQFDVEAIIADASRIPFDQGERRMAGGYQVVVDPTLRTGVAVRDGDRAILLGSSTLTQADLLVLVGGSALIARVTNDDPRR